MYQVSLTGFTTPQSPFQAGERGAPRGNLGVPLGGSGGAACTRLPRSLLGLPGSRLVLGVELPARVVEIDVVERRPVRIDGLDGKSGVLERREDLRDRPGAVVDAASEQSSFRAYLSNPVERFDDRARVADLAVG